MTTAVGDMFYKFNELDPALGVKVRHSLFSALLPRNTTAVANSAPQHFQGGLDSDEEDEADYTAKLTDAYILVASTEDDSNSLQVQVYDEEAGRLFGKLVVPPTTTTACTNQSAKCARTHPPDLAATLCRCCYQCITTSRCRTFRCASSGWTAHLRLQPLPPPPARRQQWAAMPQLVHSTLLSRSGTWMCWTRWSLSPFWAAWTRVRHTCTLLAASHTVGPLLLTCYPHAHTHSPTQWQADQQEEEEGQAKEWHEAAQG